jgi:hypothetical protein
MTSARMPKWAAAPQAVLRLFVCGCLLCLFKLINQCYICAGWKFCLLGGCTLVAF